MPPAFAIATLLVSVGCFASIPAALWAARARATRGVVSRRRRRKVPDHRYRCRYRLPVPVPVRYRCRYRYHRDRYRHRHRYSTGTGFTTVRRASRRRRRRVRMSGGVSGPTSPCGNQLQGCPNFPAASPGVIPFENTWDQSKCPARTHANSGGPTCWFEQSRYWCDTRDLLHDPRFTAYGRWACYWCSECWLNAWEDGMVSYSPPWPPITPPPPGAPSPPPMPPSPPPSPAPPPEDQLTVGAIVAIAIVCTLVTCACGYWCFFSSAAKGA